MQFFPLVPFLTTRWKIASSISFIGLSLVVVQGCSNSTDKKEAETPKYQVADENASSETKSEPKGDSNSTAADSTENVPPPPASIAANPPPSGLGQVPSFGASGTQPDNRSFMVIKPTEATDAKGLAQFIAETEQAFRDLVLSYQGQQVTEAILRDRGAALGRMKLQAAEKLIEVGTETVEKEAGMLAKLEALSQMTGFQDTKAARQLESFAKEIEKIESPKIAHHAALVLFSFRLQDFNNGQLESAQVLLDMMDGLLADKTLLGVPDLRMLQKTLGQLQASGDQAAFEAAKKKVVDAFADHPSPNLMMEAWQMNVSGSISLSNVQKAIESVMLGEENAASTNLLKEAIEAFITEFPQPATMMTIASQAIQVEYSGKVEHAKVMIDAVATRLNEIKQPEFQSEVKKIVDEFQLRYGLIGKPLNLTGLVDSEGKELDLAAYKGKVVLIDFWATWCQPCLREFPNLTNVYAELKDKGFEIVGINLDEKAEDLAAYQAKSPLSWKIVRSSNPAAVGFATPAAVQVGVSAIPLMILIDANGNVAAIHIRGEKIQPKVMELLSATASGGA